MATSDLPNKYLDLLSEGYTPKDVKKYVDELQTKPPSQVKPPTPKVPGAKPPATTTNMSSVEDDDFVSSDADNFKGKKGSISNSMSYLAMTEDDKKFIQKRSRDIIDRVFSQGGVKELKRYLKEMWHLSSKGLTGDALENALAAKEYAESLLKKHSSSYLSYVATDNEWIEYLSAVWDDVKGLESALEDLKWDLKISSGMSWTKDLQEAIEQVSNRILELKRKQIKNKANLSFAYKQGPFSKAISYLNTKDSTEE